MVIIKLYGRNVMIAQLKDGSYYATGHHKASGAIPAGRVIV